MPLVEIRLKASHAQFVASSHKMSPSGTLLPPNKVLAWIRAASYVISGMSSARSATPLSYRLSAVANSCFIQCGSHSSMKSFLNSPSLFERMISTDLSVLVSTRKIWNAFNVSQRGPRSTPRPSSSQPPPPPPKSPPNSPPHPALQRLECISCFHVRTLNKSYTPFSNTAARYVFAPCKCKFPLFIRAPNSFCRWGCLLVVSS